MTTTTEKTTEQTFADYLAAHGVTFTAALVGETNRDGWTCDEWRVRLDRRVDPGAKPRTLETDYFTGTGHRKSKRPMPADISRLRPTILARVDWEKANLRPVAPAAAGVLHSLLLDAGADGESFGDWCANYGYDTDSRKALSTYLACQETAEKLRAFFTSAERAELAALLEDY